MSSDALTDVIVVHTEGDRFAHVVSHQDVPEIEDVCKEALECCTTTSTSGEACSQLPLCMVVVTSAVGGGVHSPDAQVVWLARSIWLQPSPAQQ